MTLPECQNPGNKMLRSLRAAGGAIIVAGIMSHSLAFAASPTPGEVAQAQWRENILRKETPGMGCFKASFPVLRWEPTPCRSGAGGRPVPRVDQTLPTTVGNTDDYVLVAPGANLITQAVGTFPSVVGVTSESSVGVPAFMNQGTLGANEYTLQINTNANSQTCPFTPAAGCRVWQQFVYSTDYITSGTADVFIQYWLLGYGATAATTSCPGTFGQQPKTTNCYMNSTLIPAPDVSPLSLGNLKLSAAAVSKGNDTVTFTNGTTAYGMSFPDSVLNIANVWNQSEFNVFGDNGGSEAVFNTGAVITVKETAQYGSAAAPTCLGPLSPGTTGETNNLNLLPCSATGGTTPSIQFIESLDSPPTISKSFSPTSIPLGGTSTVAFLLTNPNTGFNLTGAAFTDFLSGMAAAGGAVSTTCSSISPAALSAGATNLSFSNITIPAGGSCTVSFSVTGAVPGVLPNFTSGLSSNEALPGNPSNTATLTVVAPPSITKTFVPNKFIPGGTTTVGFSITNPNATALTGVAFTDTLPAGLVVASPNGLSSTCGGTATANAGSGTISLSNGGIPSGGACTVSVTVTAPEGIYPNSVQVTSINGGVGNTSSATVSVATPPKLSKTFGAVSIGSMSSTTLSFTLMNPNHSVTLDALQFSDTLPAGLVISTPNGLTGSCGGGTITAPAGGNLITLGSAVLAPQASCTFSVNVTSTGIIGNLTNTTSTVTSTEALPGAAASANIFIGDPFQVSYTTNLNIGESYIDITNTGADGAPLLGPGFGGTTGNICVNVYAFDPGEELIACCSCLITPDQTVNLGANRDLMVKTLTGTQPTSITVKLLATLAGAGGSASSCPQSAATVGTATLSNSLAAWGTKLHATPTGAYATTEAAFTGAALSAGELASIGGRCASILGNGSGFGVCNSCQAGALGASKLPQ